jgi:hypothetical protein
MGGNIVKNKAFMAAQILGGLISYGCGDGLDSIQRSIDDALGLCQLVGEDPEAELTIVVDRKKQQKRTKPHQPDLPIETPIIMFPCKDGEWPLVPSFATKLKKAYKNINVTQELRKAFIWCEGHESQRKTMNGMKAFLQGWMGRVKPESSPATEDSDLSLTEQAAKRRH